MQFYAAICVHRFCRHYEVNDAELNRYIHHLASIMTMKDVVGWADSFDSSDIDKLAVCLPERFSAMMPTATLKDLEALIGYSAEVGLVDMYGAPTNDPQLFLRKCLAILDKHQIAVPDLQNLNPNREHEEWGGIISKTELAVHLAKHDVPPDNRWPLIN